VRLDKQRGSKAAIGGHPPFFNTALALRTKSRQRLFPSPFFLLLSSAFWIHKNRRTFYYAVPCSTIKQFRIRPSTYSPFPPLSPALAVEEFTRTGYPLSLPLGFLLPPFVHYKRKLTAPIVFIMRVLSPFPFFHSTRGISFLVPFSARMRLPFPLEKREVGGKT